jgi:hypothetical protein
MPGIWGNSFQALDATTVYVLGSDGKLWRETGDLNNRSQVDANVGLFSALDATMQRRYMSWALTVNFGVKQET